MKFLIAFHHVDGVWDSLTPAQREGHGAQLRDFMRALKQEKGADLVFLAPKAAAKTVRIRPGGSPEVLDGPAIASAEYPGGYYIIDAESIDEAVEWAKKGRFLVGSNEVRQIVDLA